MVIPGGIVMEMSLPAGIPAKSSVWLVALDLQAPIPAWSDTSLNTEEIAKVYRYRNHADRLRSCVARDALRSLLGRVLGIRPKSVQIRNDKHAKPYLYGVDGVAFNVSHSGEYILVAITNWPTVGIDIEMKCDDLPEQASIHAALLSPKEISQDRTCILDFWLHWTLKEASLKALGTGLTSELRSIAIVPNSKCSGYDVDHENPSWPELRVWDLNLPNGYVGAIAGAWARTLNQ